MMKKYRMQKYNCVCVFPGLLSTGRHRSRRHGVLEGSRLEKYSTGRCAVRYWKARAWKNAVLEGTLLDAVGYWKAPGWKNTALECAPCGTGRLALGKMQYWKAPSWTPWRTGRLLVGKKQYWKVRRAVLESSRLEKYSTGRCAVPYWKAPGWKNIVLEGTLVDAMAYWKAPGWKNTILEAPPRLGF